MSDSAGETPAAPPDPWETVDAHVAVVLDTEARRCIRAAIDAALATEHQHHAAQLAEKDEEIAIHRGAEAALVLSEADLTAARAEIAEKDEQIKWKHEQLQTTLCLYDERVGDIARTRQLEADLTAARAEIARLKEAGALLPVPPITGDPQ